MNIEELKKCYAEDKNIEYKKKLLQELIQEKAETKRKIRTTADTNIFDPEAFWEKEKKNKEQPSKEKADIYRWSVELNENTTSALYLLVDYAKEINKLIEKLEEELETENKKITEYTKKE